MVFSPGIKVPEHEEVLVVFKPKLVTLGADELLGKQRQQEDGELV